MKVLSLQLIIKNYEEEQITKEFYENHLAQMGVYCFGTETRNLTKDELKEVMAEVPNDIFED